MMTNPLIRLFSAGQVDKDAMPKFLGAHVTEAIVEFENV